MLALFALLSLAACAPKYTIRFNPDQIPVGRHFLYRQITETEFEMRNEKLEDDASSLETTTVDFTMTLDRAQPNGNSEWTIFVLRYQQSETKGGVTKSYDSNEPVSADEPDDVQATIFGVLDSISYRFTVDAQGNILKKEGMDEMWNRAENALSAEHRPMFKQVAKQFKKQGAMDFTTQLWEYLPPKPIKKGNSWKKQKDVPLLNLTKKLRYTLVDADASTYKIAIASQMPEDPEHPGELAVGPIKILYRMGGTGTGSIILDKRWNMAQSFYAEDVVSGTMETKVPFLASTKIPTTIRTKTRLELVSK